MCVRCCCVYLCDDRSAHPSNNAVQYEAWVLRSHISIGANEATLEAQSLASTHPHDLASLVKSRSGASSKLQSQLQ